VAWGCGRLWRRARARFERGHGAWERFLPGRVIQLAGVGVVSAWSICGSSDSLVKSSAELREGW